MKLRKIVVVCAANAFRSPSIDACIGGRLDQLGSDLESLGRGVKAKYYSDMIAGKNGIPEKYVDGALARAVSSPGNYSENIRNMMDEKVDEQTLARHILAEERHMYSIIIERFCDETGLPYPSGYHQQLLESDLKQAHIIVASDKEKELIDLPEEKMTVLGINDVLGGTYKAKKPVLEEIKQAVDEMIPKIIEKYS
ncbi:hypothetical protein KY343_04400 [Candidatus Woesearchaeota archaeon]|nr:hypothetical protein [Candidatus Woesearchaeota archaeon]